MTATVGTFPTRMTHFMETWSWMQAPPPECAHAAWSWVHKIKVFTEWNKLRLMTHNPPLLQYRENLQTQQNPKLTVSTLLWWCTVCTKQAQSGNLDTASNQERHLKRKQGSFTSNNHVTPKTKGLKNCTNWLYHVHRCVSLMPLFLLGSSFQFKWVWTVPLSVERQALLCYQVWVCDLSEPTQDVPRSSEVILTWPTNPIVKSEG